MKQVSHLLCCLAVGSTALVFTHPANAQATSQDKQFLTNASQSNYDEIQLGKLAQQKASNASVKSFGQRMITDHTKLTQKMKPFADQWGIAPPASLSSDAQQEYDKLQGLSGNEFDKEYISDMVKDHTKDLGDFNTEISETKDTKFKAAVQQGKTVVATHKTMATNLQNKL